MASKKPQKTIVESLSAGFDLNRLGELMRQAGCTVLYAKRLAPNDNNKNQPYFATRGEMRVFNILPVRTMRPHRNTRGEPSFIADVDFTWLTAAGSRHPAPRTKLILYPQYPEVRFSGFLEGSTFPGGDMLRYDPDHSLPERILFIGVSHERQAFGFITLATSAVAREYEALGELPQVGVFHEVPLRPAQDSRTALCRELRRIHGKGWIPAATMQRDGNSRWTRVPCEGTRCGGCTIETELGIPPNGIAEPDFQGWEVKQHGVTTFARLDVGVITLFTPEPQGGYYRDQGVIPFLRKYGYADLNGRADRINFGGIHRVGSWHGRTHLTLALPGYDARTGKITDSTGGIALQERDGTVAALWPYAGLLEHWNRKHARAVYVPSLHQTVGSEHQYAYGNSVRLAEETDFLLFLHSMANGKVYFDPGIKMENASADHPQPKRRNQFRIKSSDVGCLYQRLSRIDVREY